MRKSADVIVHFFMGLLYEKLWHESHDFNNTTEASANTGHLSVKARIETLKAQKTSSTNIRTF